MRKLKQLSVVMIGVLLVVSVLAGCQTSPAKEAKPEKILTQIQASSLGGTIYTWSVAASKVLNKYSVVAEYSVNSGISLVNYPLLEGNKIQIASGGTTTFYEATGKTERPGLTNTNVRMLWALFPAPYLFRAPRDSRWKSLQEIPAGTRLSIDQKGSISEALFNLACDALGINPKAKGWSLEYLPTAQSVKAYTDGKIDVYGKSAGLPAPDLMEMAASTRGVRVFGFTDEESRAFLAKYSGVGYLRLKAAAGIQAGIITEDIGTIGNGLVMLASKDLPDKVAYEFAKIVSERHAEIVQTYQAAAQSTPQATIDAAASSFVLHPGVEKYFRDAGYLK